MLWTTIGILTTLLIFGLGAQSLQHGHGERIRWFLRLMAVWGLNAALGASVFWMVDAGTIENYWVWKPLLVLSSIIFMGVIGTCLYVVRHVSMAKTPTFGSNGYGLGIAGIAGFALGTFTLISIWI